LKRESRKPVHGGLRELSRPGRSAPASDHLFNGYLGGTLAPDESKATVQHYFDVGVR
jgi:hypothetical protein